MEEFNNIENSDTLFYDQKHEIINELKNKINNDGPYLTQSDEYTSTVIN